MATRDITTDDLRIESSRPGSHTTRGNQGVVPDDRVLGDDRVIAAILVAAQQADNFEAPRAWTLVAAVAIGYMVSRGLARSSSDYRDRDDER